MNLPETITLLKIAVASRRTCEKDAEDIYHRAVHQKIRHDSEAEYRALRAQDHQTKNELLLAAELVIAAAKGTNEPDRS
jgi:hypothetical protein